MLNNLKKILLFSILLLFYSYYVYNFHIFINHLPIGIYNVKVEIYSNYMKVINIDAKNVDKQIYLINDKNLQKGRYVIIYEILENKNGKIKGKTYSYKKSKFLDTILKIENSIDEKFEFELASFIKATIFSNKLDIDKDLKNKLNYLNLIHILTISGLHISIILSFSKKLLNLFELNDKQIILTEYIILITYISIIGVSSSLTRIVILEAVNLFLFLFNKKLELSKRYLISIFCILLYNLFNIFNQAFIYTFISVFSINFVFPKIKIFIEKKIKNKIIKNLLIIISFNLIVQIYLMPFIYIFNKNILLLSFLSNIFILPIASILINIIYLIVLFNFLGVDFFNVLLELVYKIFKFLINQFYNIKYMSIQTIDINIVVLLIMFIIIIIIYYIIEKVLD